MKTLPVLTVLLASCLGLAQRSGTQQVDAAKLAKLEKAYASAKAAFARQPAATGVKAKYVSAALDLGLGTMYAKDLPANKKYRAALGHFREVLKHDPKNKIAKEQHDLIVSIYKQMGMPVPK